MKDRIHDRFPGCVCIVTNARLAEYDAAHDTQYFFTLKTFLQCERSYKNTAGKLFVHKNTVLYRISKAREMYLMDLSDADEREYIAVSLSILEGNTGFKKKVFFVS